MQTVSFAVNGQTIATLMAPPFEANYPISRRRAGEFVVGITVRAIDFNGNTADASGVVSITAASAADTTPPTIDLTAPLQAFTGKTIALSAAAADNVGVAAVSFFVDGVNVATSTAAPYTFTLTLAASYPAGSVLHLSARAVDFSGLQATDSAQTLIVSSSSAGQGILTGEAYDDAAGLPLAGVTATLTGTDASGASYTQTAVTDARGRWVLHAAEGEGVVRLAKPGWTQVDRKASIVPDQALELVDARLTALSGAGDHLTSVLGGTVQTASITLVVPPGALQETMDLRLTNVSQQGLEGILPAGWSPIAAADIAPHGASFAGGAALSLSVAAGVPAGTHVVVATWDEEPAMWRAVGDLDVSSRRDDPRDDGASVRALRVPHSRFLPNRPPPAVIGEELKGIADAPLGSQRGNGDRPAAENPVLQPGRPLPCPRHDHAPASPAASGAMAEARIT